MFTIAIYHSVFVVDYGEHGFVAIPRREQWTPITATLMARLVKPGVVEFKTNS